MNMSPNHISTHTSLSSLPYVHVSQPYQHTSLSSLPYVCLPTISAHTSLSSLPYVHVSQPYQHIQIIIITTICTCLPTISADTDHYHHYHMNMSPNHISRHRSLSSLPYVHVCQPYYQHTHIIIITTICAYDIRKSVTGILWGHGS